MSNCLGQTKAGLQAMCVAYIEATRQERNAILAGQTVGELADATIRGMLEKGMLKECSVHPGHYILPGGISALSNKKIAAYNALADAAWPAAGVAEVWTRTSIRTFRRKHGAPNEDPGP